MDYKDSLILPNTTFPMRADLPKNEQIRYKKWNNEDSYKKMVKRGGAKNFTLHDGPPYANGHTHIGHALNKILKDIIVKYHYFQGDNIRYVPGWDCHGLPIEQQVEKKIGKAKQDTLAKSKIRELCRKHADEFIEIQINEFIKLGVLGDFKNPYKTMYFDFEAEIYKVLCDIAKKGILSERSKPIFWSWAAKTALAEAEVEYKDKVSDSIYVAFKLDEESKKKLAIKTASIVIWTTTPWTLPANQAIALNKDEYYALLEDGNIVAKSLVAKLQQDLVVSGNIIKEWKGQELEDLVAKNPLNDRDSKVILGDHVGVSDGTGAVHTAPGHGEDDYMVALKYKIEVIMPVDDGGKYDESLVLHKLLRNAESFVGMHIFDANSKILEMLGDSLLKAGKFTHSYPHCWRTHEPVIFRATRQVFINMDEKIKGSDKTLREIALSEIDKTRFYPESGKNRLYSMIKNRPDWCISRQRNWGVPIAFFRNKKTGELLLEEDVLSRLYDIFKEKGADAWWDKEIQELLPAKYNADEYEKINHILDVWFDSGSTWRAVLQNTKYDAGDFPASMYLEGSDQHRGWFHSSLLVSCAVNSHAPYKSVLTHGFTVDDKGEKMSKSKGNVVAPEDIIKEFGSEILRLWVANSDYQSDLRISNNILKQATEQYKKIRNTLRFLLANTNDLENLKTPTSEIDMWILDVAKKAFDKTNDYFKVYEFAKGLQVLSYFIVNELSGIYLDICKDTLYCDSKDSQKRISAQSAMVLIAQRMLALLAPIFTYTIDEIMEHASPLIKNGANDVFDIVYKPLDSVKKIEINDILELRIRFYELVDSLKKEQKIKSTLELEISASKDLNSDLVCDLLMLSGVTSDTKRESVIDFGLNGISYRFYIANKHKCPRCWKFVSKNIDEVCPRCEKVLNV